MNTAVEDQIEELRLLMQKIASDKNLTDSRVVEISEKLDDLINLFYCSRKKEQTV